MPNTSSRGTASQSKISVRHGVQHSKRRAWSPVERATPSTAHAAALQLRARVDAKTAMAITGHKDDKIFRRYQQVAESDVKSAAKRLEAYLTGQVVEISGQVSGQVRTQRKAKVRK